MAYRKRNYRRRRRARKAPASYSSYPSHYLKYGWKAAKSLAPIIGPMLGLNTENKVKSVTLASSAVSADSPNFWHLSDVDNGTGVDQRTGFSIRCKKLTSRLIFKGNTSGAPAVVRCMMIKYNANATPTIGEVLAGATGVAADICNPYNKQNLDMSVLYDKTFWVGSATSSTLFIKPLNLSVFNQSTIKYDGATGSTDNIANKFYIVLISDILAAANPPTVSAQANMYYVDN